MNAPTFDGATEKTQRTEASTCLATTGLDAAHISSAKTRGLIQERVLLTNGDYAGTLAAARVFSKAGLTVQLADANPASLCSVSKHTNQRFSCPPPHQLQAMGDWLLEEGPKQAGALLYPCSDDLAWVIAHFREPLSRYYRLYQPPIETIEQLLDKSQLYRLCEDNGIATPQTLFPEDQTSLESACSQINKPYLIKPKAQLGLSVNQKSLLVSPSPRLAEQYQRYRARFLSHQNLASSHPQLTWPMLQRFNPTAAQQTISVSGFCTAGCETFIAASSRKVLQYPLNIGVGLCFESTPLDPALAEAVRTLCLRSGYFGVFEVEFVRLDEQYQLIDFNPRFFGQMQLDISRGLDMPGYVLAGALNLPITPPSEIKPGRIAQRGLLRTLMTTQWLAGRVSRSERKYWLNFVQPGNGITVTDHVYDAEDPRPAWKEWLRRLLKYLRHPRSSMKILFGSS